MAAEFPFRTAADPWLDGRPPHVPASRADVPAVCLLPGDPARVELAAEVLDDFRLVGTNREFTFGVGRFAGTPIGICSTGIGGPSAEIAVVELQRLGASTMIRVGGMGTLRARARPRHRVRGDPGRRPGAEPPARTSPSSRGCPPRHRPARPHPRQAAPSTPRRPRSRWSRPTRTTSARDARSAGLDGAAAPSGPHSPAQGVDGIDMETETVLAVGRAGRPRGRPLLVAHGNRATDAWLDDYGPAQLAMLRLAVRVAGGLGGDADETGSRRPPLGTA